MSHVTFDNCDVAGCPICIAHRDATRVYRTRGTTSTVDMAELARQAERQAEAEAISHPAHYTYSSVEPTSVIEAWALPYHLGCVAKYLCRYRAKGHPLEDLKKARWYLERYILLLERQGEA